MRTIGKAGSYGGRTLLLTAGLAALFIAAAPALSLTVSMERPMPSTARA